MSTVFIIILLAWIALNTGDFAYRVAREDDRQREERKKNLTDNKKSDSLKTYTRKGKIHNG